MIARLCLYVGWITLMLGVYALLLVGMDAAYLIPSAVLTAAGAVGVALQE